jgi:hypothetical protein
MALLLATVILLFNKSIKILLNKIYLNENKGDNPIDRIFVSVRSCAWACHEAAIQQSGVG